MPIGLSAFISGPQLSVPSPLSPKRLYPLHSGGALLPSLRQASWLVPRSFIGTKFDMEIVDEARQVVAVKGRVRWIVLF